MKPLCFNKAPFWWTVKLGICKFLVNEKSSLSPGCLLSRHSLSWGLTIHSLLQAENRQQNLTYYVRADGEQVGMFK